MTKGWTRVSHLCALAFVGILLASRPGWSDPRAIQTLNKLADHFYVVKERRLYRPDISERGNATHLRAVGRMERRLSRIRPADLNQQARITYHALQADLKAQRTYLTDGWIKEDLNGTESMLHTLTNSLDRSRNNARDWRWLIKTLQNATPFVDGYIGQLRQGIKEGRTRNRGAVKSSIEYLASLTTRSVKDNPFWALEAELSKKLAEHKQLPQLRRELHAAIRDNVLPAASRLERFLQKEYLPKASKLGTNRARYLYHMAQHLGADHPSPETLGRWGRREVKRLLGELQQTARQIDPKATSLPRFMRKLSQDESNHFESAGELIDAGRGHLGAAIKHARRMVPVPRSKISVTSVPGYLDATTAAQYIADSKKKEPVGEMQLNTGKLLSSQLRSELATLITHEAFPGHHLAYVYAKKQKNLPKYRKEAMHTAFGEGWALYTEQWRAEDGGFAPIERVGYLTNQLWRAARLVVDTGLHTGTMTPGQAVRYFQRATFCDRAAAKAEIQRYIDWPGQALAYYYGKDHLLETRRQVKKILGKDYNGRRYHAKLLSLIAVPMDEARAVMLSWARRSKGQLRHRRASAPRSFSHRAAHVPSHRAPAPRRRR